MRILVGLAVLALASFPSAALAAPSDDVPAAAADAQAPSLFIQSDYVLGAPACAPQARFSVGDRVIFRAKVYDAHTGEEITDGTVVARLADGTVVNMTYEPRPPERANLGPSTDAYWSGVWAVRPDTPLGIMRYTVEATSGSRTGTFTPFNNDSSMLTIVARS
jgi:hypothetical protein